MRGPGGQNPLSSSQLKPKRVGAGFPKGSCQFQTATELMEKTLAKGEAPQLVQGGEQEPPGQPRDLQGVDNSEDSSEPSLRLRGEAPKSAHCGGPSPEKKAKGPSRGSAIAKARTNKKQQLLATAARKDSQSIARFFCQRAESPAPCTAAPGAEGASPSCEGAQGLPALTPEKCTGEEDGAPGHLAACPQTKEHTGLGPR